MTDQAMSFSVRVEELGFLGRGLARPECVLATARGDLFTSDRRGGVCRLGPEGGQTLLGEGSGLLPNGIALLRDGSFLIANLGPEGGVWRLDGGSGQVAPHLLDVDGRALPAVNFVRLDAEGRLWICANPHLSPDGRYETETAAGVIAVADAKGARIAADGIGWANECVVHPSGRHLFVNETFARRLTRFDIGPDGSLSGRRTVTQFGPGAYPDGLALDDEDGLWVVSVASNRVIRVTPDGGQHVVLEDSEAAHLARLEEAHAAHRLTRADLTRPTATTLKNISSLAFGGPDRRTAYLGSIGGESLAVFRSPVAGAAPVHWTW